MATGIYCIRNLITGEFYIGSTVRNLARRWDEHRQDLRAGRHHSYRLQAAWRFYGESSFRFSVIEECLPAQCIEREQWFIDIFDPEYNICKVVGAPGSRLGFKASLETKAKLRASHLGRKASPETRAKMRVAQGGVNNAFFGHKHSPDTRVKMSAAKIGNQCHLGCKHSAAALAKIGAATKGRAKAVWASRRLHAHNPVFPFSAY